MFESLYRWRGRRAAHSCSLGTPSLDFQPSRGRHSACSPKSCNYSTGSRKKYRGYCVHRYHITFQSNVKQLTRTNHRCLCCSKRFHALRRTDRIITQRSSVWYKWVQRFRLFFFPPGVSVVIIIIIIRKHSRNADLRNLAPHLPKHKFKLKSLKIHRLITFSLASALDFCKHLELKNWNLYSCKRIDALKYYIVPSFS